MWRTCQRKRQRACDCQAPPERPAINPFVEPSHALAKQACWGIALVMILACLFSTLDNVVTLSNAHGTIAV